jgi:hypothetical protein
LAGHEEERVIPKMGHTKTFLLWKPLMILGLGLVLGATTTPAAPTQNQQDQAQPSTMPQDSQPQGQVGSPDQARPQDQQDPTMQQPQPPSQPQDVQPQGQPAPQAQGQLNQGPPPQSLTIAAGTVIRVRVDEWLSSDHNLTGDSFSAVLAQPIVVDGWVVARRGQAQTGRVSVAKKGRFNEASQLGLDLSGLTLVDGQQLPLQTELFQTTAPATPGRDAAVVGSTTGAGAVIGAIAGGGPGAAIGAGVGATAGIIGVMSTKGRPTVIAPETVLAFRLKDPVTISTEKGQMAFQPVTQSDYDSPRTQQARPRMVRPGPPPPPPYYPYPYAYGYPYPYGWYPAPYVGYGYYGRFGGWR